MEKDRNRKMSEAGMRRKLSGERPILRVRYLHQFFDFKEKISETSSLKTGTIYNITLRKIRVENFFNLCNTILVRRTGFEPVSLADFCSQNRNGYQFRHRRVYPQSRKHNM